MSENITFNDKEVSVEIFDAVLGKMVVTDFLQEDASKLDYLKNKDLIATVEELEEKQDTLEASTGILLEENVISIKSEDLPSADSDNRITLGEDGKISVKNLSVFDVVLEVPITLSSCAIKAIENIQMQVKFTVASDLLPENTPVQLLSISDTRTYPLFSDRFGQIWDPSTFSCVGFCRFSNLGALTIKVTSTLVVGNEYIILV